MLAWLISCSVSWCPPSSSLPAIGWPMLPTPRYPICMAARPPAACPTFACGGGDGKGRALSLRGAKRRGNLGESAHRHRDCRVASLLAMTAGGGGGVLSAGGQSGDAPATEEDQRV